MAVTETYPAPDVDPDRVLNPDDPDADLPGDEDTTDTPDPEQPE